MKYEMASEIQKNYISREHLYSLGRDIKLDCYILSIPVANTYVDYEEYYKLSEQEFHLFMNNEELAKNFANECRLRQHDDLLTLVPGTDRGVPR